MTENLNAEQIKKVNIEKMGVELGEIYSQLWQEVTWLYWKWEEYIELFGKKPSRIDIINKCAPQYFYMIEKASWADIILHIARLTDPPFTGNKQNLTIQQFIRIIKDEKFKGELAELIKLILDRTRFCRDWRNRQIAHSDLNRALNPKAYPLALASRQKVADALKAIGDIMNHVALYYKNSTTAFNLGGNIGGAEALLFYLIKGLKYEDEREKRIRNGNYTNADFEHDEF